ncbi:MAG: glycosyltransferase [Chloroflexota bacterium]|nr:glycosyltransferase [Chloroflexota bacterium]
MPDSLNIVILGLSITSSWGNGHATTYRGLVRELTRRGHDVLFLERDKPWYASNRDMPDPPWGRTELYDSLDDLKARFTEQVREADLVIVGSYVPEGVAVGEWVTQTARGATAFYDIDTPVTLAKLERGDTEYLAPHLITRYGMYLSFTGGPTLDRIERQYGSPMARALYCSVDPELYYPIWELGIRNADLVGVRANPKSEIPIPNSYDLGYMGTYSDDRQPPLDRLMLEPARRWAEGKFIVAGPQYPEHIVWPPNVRRVEHLPPAEHREFYNAQRFTLNITRADMVKAGYSPSVRLFEAAACGVPIISDYWDGLDTIFEFRTEILVSRSPEDTLTYLRELSEEERQGIGERARRRVLENHTSAHRAAELEAYARELLGKQLVPNAN